MKRAFLFISFSLLSLAAFSQGHLYLHAQDEWQDAGDVFDLTLKVHDGFDSVVGFQFCKKFDQHKLQFVSVTPGADIPGYGLGNFGLWNIDTGSIRTLWSDPYPKSAPDGADFFTLRFVALEEVLLSDVVSLDVNHPVLKPSFYTEPLVLGDLTFFWDPSPLTGTEEPAIADVSVFPNPAPCGAAISVMSDGLPAPAALYDASGRLVSSTVLDGSLVLPQAPGFYFVRSGSQVKTVVAR